MGRYQRNISAGYSRVKNLSCVSCAAWNVFPINLLVKVKAYFFPWCTPFLYIVIILEPWMMNLCLGSAPDNHQNCQPNLRQKSTLDWDELISNEKSSTQIISYKVQIFREGPQKFEKISSFVLTSLSNFKNRWEIFPNFVAFSQYLNFNNVLPKLIHINIPSFFIA